MDPIIKSLTLKRFRSFIDTEVAFDNPTFLVGPNGSGKSNLVDALAFLSDAMDVQVGPALSRRGGFETVKHRSAGGVAFDEMGLGVTLGFGPTGLALLAEIRPIEDLDLLRKILHSIKPADSPEALRRLWSKA